MKRCKVFLSLVTAIALCAFVGISGCSQNDSNTGDDQSLTDGSTPVDFVWSINSECSLCHTTEFASMEDSSSIASSHAQMECISCHSDESGLEKVHDNVSGDDKTATRLKKTVVAFDLCITCHNKEELASKTASYEGLKDERGSIANPHDISDTPDHNNILCVDCHKTHSPVEDSASNAMNACLTCHHEKVFECGTCHNH